MIKERVSLPKGNDGVFSVFVYKQAQEIHGSIGQEVLRQNREALNLSEVQNLSVKAKNTFSGKMKELPYHIKNDSEHPNLLFVEFPKELQEIASFNLIIEFDIPLESLADKLLHRLVELPFVEITKSTEKAPMVEDVVFVADVVPAIIGEKGERGKDGINGTNGENGRDGRDGVDGRNGIDGENGKSALDYLNENNSEFIEKLKELLPQGGEINYNEEYFNYENMKKILQNYGNHLKDYLIEKEEEGLKSKGLGFTLFYVTPQKIDIKRHFRLLYKTSDNLIYKPLYRPIPKMKYAPTYIQKDYTISNRLNYKYGIEIYPFRVDSSKTNITFVYEYENTNYIYILDFEQLDKKKRQKLFADSVIDKIKGFELVFSDDIQTIEGDKLNKLKESYPNLAFAKKAVVSDIIEKVD